MVAAGESHCRFTGFVLALEVRLLFLHNATCRQRNAWERSMSGRKLSVILLLVFILSPVFADRRDAYFENRSFFIKDVERDDGEISIEFSVPINPDSVAGGSILVDGMPLPLEARIIFNRRGDKMVIREIPQWRGRVLCLEIRNLVATTGIAMVPMAAFHLWPGGEIEGDELDEVDWCHHY